MIGGLTFALTSLSWVWSASHGSTRFLDGPESGALDGWREAAEDDGGFDEGGSRCGLEEEEETDVTWVLVDETEVCLADRVLAGDAAEEDADAGD